MSYLTTGEEAQVNQAFNVLHNFFAKRYSFVSFEEETNIFPASTNNHNAFFPNAPTNNIETIINTGSFNARIYYSRMNYNSISAGDKFVTEASIPDGWIRIVVDGSGKNIVESAKRIRFDDELYTVESKPSRHGLLQKEFYNFYLKPVD